MHPTTVNPTDPGIYYAALGDPRSYENIDPAQLRKGDFAFIVCGERAGAVYYMRPRDGKPPQRIFDDHEVLGVNLMLGPSTGIARGQALLAGTAKQARLSVEVQQGPDQDGIRDTFHVFA